MVSIRSNLVRTSSLPPGISTKTAGLSWLRMWVTRSMGAVEGTCGSGGAHDFADDELAEIFSLQGEIQDLIFEDGADGFSFFEDGKLRNILLLHGLQGVEDGLIGAGDDDFARFAGLALDADHVGGGEGDFGVHVAVLAHPAVVKICSGNASRNRA